MLFNGRRQSRDRAVCQDILRIAGDAPVWMRQYSRKLFEAAEQQIRIYEGTIEDVADDACFFVETDAVEPLLPLADTLILYRWNRVYPADVRLPAQILDLEWKRTDTYEFPGHSHDVLTREVYVR